MTAGTHGDLNTQMIQQLVDRLSDTVTRGDIQGRYCLGSANYLMKKEQVS